MSQNAITERCGGGGSCGDCRDYQVATTDWEHLLVVCGQSTDHTVKVTRFADQIVCERNFPAVNAAKIPLKAEELQNLVKLAQEGRVEVIHRLRNEGTAAIKLAPWSLTMVAPGGTGVHGFSRAVRIRKTGIQPIRCARHHRSKQACLRSTATVPWTVIKLPRIRHIL